MRIPIREQLTAFTLFTTLVALAVVAIATWITNHNFVLSIRASRLALTAQLKAAQLNSNLALLESSVYSLTTRIRLQSSLQSYIQGDTSSSNWQIASFDIDNGISSSPSQIQNLQAMLFPVQNTSGPIYSVVNVTNPNIQALTLPYAYPNGTAVNLGDAGLGYPTELYPNITFNGQTNKTFAMFGDQELGLDSGLLIGPVTVNDTYALVSVTFPVVNNNATSETLGWLTVLFDMSLIEAVVKSSAGVDKTGVALIVGPNNVYNRFAGTPSDEAPPYPREKSAIEADTAHFVLSPNLSSNAPLRRGANQPFPIRSYPALLTALTEPLSETEQYTTSKVNTKNEDGAKIGVGWAIPDTTICDWVLLVEQSHSAVYAPLTQLRNILLACVFITAAVMIIITWPLAHLFVRPIRLLRNATSRSVEPPGPDDSSGKFSIFSSSHQDLELDGNFPDFGSTADSTGASVLASFQFWKARSRKQSAHGVPTPVRVRIPGKVKVSKHGCVRDELTELTSTFNEMSEELSLNYHRLEERVRQRTAELELSKKAAEAANESKTLFIANISHELKSPLNAILGLAAVCMQEQDPAKVQQSLSMIYKSGDLLHNLLTDLLTFSKNQAGHSLTLEQKEFGLRDVPTQLKAIFDMQAKESQIKLSFEFEGVLNSLGDTNAPSSSRIYGPMGTGRVKDMQVFGDKHRLLQVVINLLSNSLKFTPAGGSVTMRTRCLEAREDEFSHRDFVQKRQFSGSQSSGQSKRVRLDHADGGISEPGSDNESPVTIFADANNARNDGHRASLGASSIVSASEESVMSAPTNSKQLMFEFEIEDTGPGIPTHLLTQIFEPFVQGDLRLTKRYGGTGLGLAIVSQLAKLMNGDIRVRSVVGQGSVFTFRVPLYLTRGRSDSQATSVFEPSNVDAHGGPLTEEAVRINEQINRRNSSRSPTPSRQIMSKAFETDKKPRLVGLSQPYFSTATTPPCAPGTSSGPSSSKKTKSKLRVLVAEDNQINQEVVLRMLRLEDIFDVHIAKDGQEAFEKVKESMEAKEPYELIFMDVQMPNLDGRQSTRAIRQIGYSAPIVALTAFADEVNQKECMDSGMNYFLAKPIRRPALRQVLKTYCSPIAEVVEDMGGAKVDRSLEVISDLKPATPESESGPSSSGDGPSSPGSTFDEEAKKSYATQTVTAMDERDVSPTGKSPQPPHLHPDSEEA